MNHTNSAQSINGIESDVALLLSSNPRLTLKEIALLTATDRHRIQQAIKEQYGFGLRELKKAILVDRARALLEQQHPRYSVKEIAAKLGVTPNYLSRLIKSIAGKCPTALRRLKG